MAGPIDDITAAELSVMEELWNRDDGATIREIVLAVYGEHEHSLHAGVKSFLDRLMEKGYARVDKRGFAHRFFAVVTREEYVGWRLKQMAESHFGGSVAPMLLSLVDQVALSKKDRAAIEKIIDNIRD